MDYHKKVSIYNAADLDTFMMCQVSGLILKKYCKYKTNNMMHIPSCMIHDSLKDALNMNRGSKVFRFLAGQRLTNNVEEFFIQQNESVEEF